MQSPFDPAVKGRNLLIGILAIAAIAYFHFNGTFYWIASWFEPSVPEEADGKTRASFEAMSFSVDLLIDVVVLIGYVTSALASGLGSVAFQLAQKVWLYASTSHFQLPTLPSTAVAPSTALPGNGTNLFDVIHANLQAFDERINAIETHLASAVLTPKTSEEVVAVISQWRSVRDKAINEINSISHAIRQEVASTQPAPVGPPPGSTPANSGATQ